MTAEPEPWAACPGVDTFDFETQSQVDTTLYARLCNGLPDCAEGAPTTLTFDAPLPSIPFAWRLTVDLRAGPGGGCEVVAYQITGEAEILLVAANVEDPQVLHPFDVSLGEFVGEKCPSRCELEPGPYDLVSGLSPGPVPHDGTAVQVQSVTTYDLVNAESVVTEACEPAVRWHAVAR